MYYSLNTRKSGGGWEKRRERAREARSGSVVARLASGGHHHHQLAGIFHADTGTRSINDPWPFFRARAPVRMHGRSYGCKCARLYQLASWIVDMRSNN